MPLLFTTIALSGSVTGDVDLTKYGKLLAIGLPVIDSGDLFIRGGFDTTSADFRRLLETRSPGSGDLRFATLAGSRMIAMPATMVWPSYVRLEVASPQTAVRTLTLLAGRW